MEFFYNSYSVERMEAITKRKFPSNSMEKKRKKRSYEGILALLSWAEACRKFGNSCTKMFVLSSLGVTWKDFLLREAWVKQLSC